MPKTFKRYSVVSVMIVLCFFSAFLALCNGLLSTSKATELIKTKNNYAYSGEMTVLISAADGITQGELFELVDNVEKCNVYLDQMMIFFEELDGAFRPDILLKQNEPLSLPTSRSVYKIPENGIVAPSGIGDELTIHGYKFRVAEKMDAEKYPFIKNLFTINAKDYFKIYPDALSEEKNIYLVISSDKSDVTEAYSTIRENAERILPSANVRGFKTSSEESVFQSAVSFDNMISAGLFLFALINTIIISYYWVTVRRREIVVRKAFGAGDLRVTGLVTGELMRLIGLSAVLAVVTQIVIWSVGGNEIGLENSIFLVGGMLLAITLAVIVSLVVPVNLILRIQPSEGVKM